jgi:hypothetical protein
LQCVVCGQWIGAHVAGLEARVESMKNQTLRGSAGFGAQMRSCERLGSRSDVERISAASVAKPATCA